MIKPRLKGAYGNIFSKPIKTFVQPVAFYFKPHFIRGPATMAAIPREIILKRFLSGHLRPFQSAQSKAKNKKPRKRGDEALLGGCFLFFNNFPKFTLVEPAEFERSSECSGGECFVERNNRGKYFVIHFSA